jgi:hypothetical protein
MGDRFHSRLGRNGVLAAIALAIAGCLSSPTEPNQTIWESAIQPAGTGSLVTGNLGAISDRHRRLTEAAINISGAEPEVELHWRIRSGVCGGTRGSVVGAEVSYAAIETDLSGSGLQNVVLTQAMSASGDFMVEVWGDAVGDVVLACGILSRL